MVDSPTVDEQPATRRSIRSCRLSTVKSKPPVEKPVEEPIADDNEFEEEEEEDPSDLFQVGDILWARVVGNPWWPALVYGSYYEDKIHTKIMKTARRGKRRAYFVYFFGPDFEYAWLQTNALMPYAGLEDFIRHAETSIQNASRRGEQGALANRFELKVTGSKRADWDKAIEEANEALKLSREERVKNFEELLKKILKNAEENKSTKRRHSSGTARPSRRTLSPSSSGNKSTTRSSVKRQKTSITPLIASTTLLHVGLPTLTKREEKRLINDLLTHPKGENFKLNEAQAFACQLARNIIKENSHYDMSCVQIEWFYGKTQLKRKQVDDDIPDSSIFDILENGFQIGDMVWAKLNGLTWWPAFVYGCFSDDGNYVKVISKPGLPTKKQYFIYSFGSHFKYLWVHEACLHRYEGLDEFLVYSEQKAKQASTKQVEEKIRKKFKINISEELHPFWKQAINEANELLTLPTNMRMSAFQKIVHRFIDETKNSVTYQIKEQVPLCDNSNDEVQQELRSRLLQVATTNELDNDVVVLRLNSSTRPSSVSLTAAIRHFLDKGLPSLTLYEEICLVNQLIHHRSGASLTFTDAQLYVEQYVIRIALRNFRHKMLYVQSDYFYDFLLKYPQIILKHRQWFQDFQPTLMPTNTDRIHLKKWQLATILHAHWNLERRLY
ncbi:unnamed protein product [Adineta ricciae]|uniref:PWWP domain-containing protein n=1 Tax=Adineta ricciae TaxID=249248 RepID=A0A813XDU3_ADIRI|nr:unnamed protein product [Adineta ricciae]